MHLEDNVAAASLGLTADELAAIDRVPQDGHPLASTT
jgi:aryl-alcohol dehydrogenase-like predicted oxidoreductase